MLIISSNIELTINRLIGSTFIVSLLVTSLQRALHSVQNPNETETHYLGLGVVIVVSVSIVRIQGIEFDYCVAIHVR